MDDVTQKESKLTLRFQQEMIQGKFSLKKLNFLLVFQVNCPGCLVYALPLLNQIQQDERLQEISLLAVSTAFEDFEYNTLEHTKALVHSGELVGASKEMLKANGYEKLPYSIDVPVAMDEVLPLDMDLTALADDMKNRFKQEGTQSQQVLSYLKHFEPIHSTFVMNAMQGTPTFVLFDDEYTVIANWFGHRNTASVINLLLGHVSL